MGDDDSPVTGCIDEDKVYLSFGRLKDRTVEYVRLFETPYYEALEKCALLECVLIKRLKGQMFELFLNEHAEITEKYGKPEVKLYGSYTH